MTGVDDRKPRSKAPKPAPAADARAGRELSDSGGAGAAVAEAATRGREMAATEGNEPAAVAFDPVLAEAGLSVTERVGSSGEPIYTIKGDTHPHRHVFRTAGGQWDRIHQHWVFTGTDPRPEVARGLREGARPPGLSDSAAPAELKDRPHYWGHRQRLRERFLGGPDDGLPDYELMELLLFFSIPRVDTKPLAKQLLERFGSLGGVLHASAEQLADYEPVDHRTLALFKAVRTLGARVAREEVSEAPVLGNWNKLVAYLRATMAHRMVEQFRLLFLDRRNVLIADEVQNQGTIDHTPVYAREVVKRALTLDASALIMVHNHPSNHPQPSPADIDMTQQIQGALKAVGVVLHDHVIVSKKGQTSFRQMGLL